MADVSTLKQQLRDNLTSAMKDRDLVRSSTLRMLLTAITNAEVAGKEAVALTDEQVLGVLSTEAKKRREAATAFRDGGRIEAAAKEDAELGVILGYMPEQLDSDAIEALVNEVVDQLGVRGKGVKAMGRVMGILQPKVKGRADGALVAATVKRLLG